MESERKFLMEELEKSALKGTFALETDKKFLGELTLAGSKSSLCLWGDNSFLGETRDKWMEKTVKAVLFDSRKVSLFGCCSEQGGHSGWRDSL